MMWIQRRWRCEFATLQICSDLENWSSFVEPFKFWEKFLTLGNNKLKFHDTQKTGHFHENSKNGHFLHEFETKQILERPHIFFVRIFLYIKIFFIRIHLWAWKVIINIEIIINQCYLQLFGKIKRLSEYIHLVHSHYET